MGNAVDDGAVSRVRSAEADVHAGTPLCGSYQHRIDEKGRVAVPAPLRRELPQGSVVAPGPERRLMIWPPDQWTEYTERIRRTAETPAQERRFVRLLFSRTYPFEVDAQGRLLLTAWQREWLQATDALVFIGVGNAVELASEATDLGDLEPDEYTRFHDLVSQRHSAGGTGTA